MTTRSRRKIVTFGHRLVTMMTVPAEGGMLGSIELLSIGSVDLAEAQRVDASAANV